VLTSTRGNDDQVVPIDASARAVKRLVKSARLIEYEGGPHGITDTHKERLNNDLSSSCARDASSARREASPRPWHRGSRIED
jgi:hypothetical protein